MNIADMRTSHSRDAYAQLKETFGDKVFETVIRASIAYAESAEKALSILEYRPDLGRRLPGAGRRGAGADRARRRSWRPGSDAPTLGRRHGYPRLPLRRLGGVHASRRVLAVRARRHRARRPGAHRRGGAGRAAGRQRRRRPARHARPPRRRHAAARDPRGRARGQGDRLLGLCAPDAGGRARPRGRRLPREGRRRRPVARRDPFASPRGLSSATWGRLRPDVQPRSAPLRRPRRIPRRHVAVHPRRPRARRAGPGRRRRADDRVAARGARRRRRAGRVRRHGRARPQPGADHPRLARVPEHATTVPCAASASRSGPAAAPPSWSSASCTRRC